MSADGAVIEGLSDDVIHLGSANTPQAVVAAAGLLAERCGKRPVGLRQAWPWVSRSCRRVARTTAVASRGHHRPDDLDRRCRDPCDRAGRLGAHRARSLDAQATARRGTATRRGDRGARLVQVPPSRRAGRRRLRRGRHRPAGSPRMERHRRDPLVWGTSGLWRPRVRQPRPCSASRATVPAGGIRALARSQIRVIHTNRALAWCVARLPCPLPAVHRLRPGQSKELEEDFVRASGTTSLDIGDDVLDHIQVSSALRPEAPEVARRVFLRPHWRACSNGRWAATRFIRFRRATCPEVVRPPGKGRPASTSGSRRIERACWTTTLGSRPYVAYFSPSAGTSTRWRPSSNGPEGPPRGQPVTSLGRDVACSPGGRASCARSPRRLVDPSRGRRSDARRIRARGCTCTSGSATRTRVPARADWLID